VTVSDADVATALIAHYRTTGDDFERMRAALEAVDQVRAARDVSDEAFLLNRAEEEL
jgi:hypothetical protein